MKTKRIPVPENWKDLKPHPLSALVPYGAGIDTVKMADHMREYGYDEGEPVILIERNGVLEILEGRHRHVGAQEADVIPTFAVFIGGDPIPYLKKKLLRQHLNESQRAMLAAALIKAAKDDERVNLPSSTPTIQEAADTVNVSRKTVVDAVKVTTEGGEKLNEQVASGQIPVSTAARVIRSVFCDRCNRLGSPVKNCAQCQELRAKTALAARKKTSKPKKIGSEKFDWKAFDHHYGYVARGPDDLKRAYGDAGEFEKCDNFLREFRKVWEAWRKRVLHSKE